MSTRFIKRRSAARVVGEAREPRLHTVVRICRRIAYIGPILRELQINQ